VSRVSATSALVGKPVAPITAADTAATPVHQDNRTFVIQTPAAAVVRGLSAAGSAARPGPSADQQEAAATEKAAAPVVLVEAWSSCTVGSDPKQVEHQLKTATESWPKELRTQTQAVSASNHPAAFFIQRLIPAAESISGRRVRLHVSASTAPIDRPDSAGQAVTLRQSACVVVLEGSTEKAVNAPRATFNGLASSCRNSLC